MIYFASDFHLGIPARVTSPEREKQIVRWLETISRDATAIYLVGDLFDFWFEYRSVVPRGYVRLLGKLAEISDSGIPIHVFTGNHDMWMFDYLEKEVGVILHRSPLEIQLLNHRFLIGHGDGLGPGDHGYKFIKQVFANPVCQWLYATLHPNLAFAMARFWSGRSRSSASSRDVWRGKDREWLVQYALEQTAQGKNIDYYIFGHRHLPVVCNLEGAASRYINLGDWLSFNSYVRYDGISVELLFFENPDGTAIWV